METTKIMKKSLIVLVAVVAFCAVGQNVHAGYYNYSVQYQVNVEYVPTLHVGVDYRTVSVPVYQTVSVPVFNAYGCLVGYRNQVTVGTQLVNQAVPYYYWK